MDEEDYDELHNMGVLFQLNLPSLTGMYGENAQKKAQMLMKKDMYHATGTDLHRLKALEILLGKKVPKGKLPQKI